ncbi:MAG TPA: MerR family transcriptional regulator [Actinomycetota bacterium]|nr:MerR family transcriptional regulator [Actinomycetota bacterium]
MPLSRARDYLSIGEVLDSVRVDFPDVTISKIRFLEAEGLIDPERTASGYRKFFERDVARLRYILSLQKDHFLPLKVIRERLAQTDSNGGALLPAVPAPDETTTDTGSNGERQAPPDMTNVQMTRSELIAAAGLDEEEMKGLEDFGVIGRRDRDVYDGDDLLVARAARRFFAFGVEPRHLKMYRQMAEREAAFFEQIVSPGMRRRDPDAQGEAARSLSELVSLSRQLREATLRNSLAELA